LSTRTAAAADLLAGVLQADRIATEPRVLAAHRHDRSGWEPAGLPGAVVFPHNADEVAAVLRTAHAAGIPVVPRGAGTGLSGAATAVDGEIVLSTARLDRILELNPDDEIAVVQPGVITAELDRAAADHGLCYPPDPGSVEISTIGGNIATNAGGLRCAKYGVTRESVLGLEVVLADGTRIHTGRRTVKGVTGYDLTGLFVGSEGTLGVVVGAVVRLLPRPVSTATLAAYFEDVDRAAAAVARIREQRLRPAIAELLDSAALAAVDAAEGTDNSARGGALLLVQTDGAGAAAEARAVLAAVRPIAAEVALTQSPAEAAALLRARRRALPALERLGRVLIEDIAVPRSRIAEALTEVSRIAGCHGVRVATLAHAADGNLHPIFVLDDAVGPVPDAVWAAAGEMFRTALRLGGTLTGEHGVGLLKRRWVAEELGEDALALHRRIKLAFDPRGILNPGKAF